jgi:SagB-type dehydrogenase family enzyme
VIVRNVSGVRSGVYRLAPEGTRLHPISSEAGEARLAGAFYGPPSVNFAHANAVIYLVADHEEALNRFGNRSYRILSQEAGVVAQRLSAAAGGMRLSARITNGYLAEGVLSVLDLQGTGRAPLFQIALGERRTTCQYEMPIIF